MTVTAKFYSMKTYGGAFPPGSTQTIADFVCQNTGDETGVINFRADRIDADGNVVSKIIECYSLSTDPNCCFIANRDEKTGTCDTAGSTCDCEGAWDNPGHVTVDLPSEGGTYYYGMKTWGADESEPPYPSPTAAATHPQKKHGK